MDYDEYSLWVSKRSGKHADPLLYAAMGCAGEGGEIVDYVKKVYFHGHVLNRAKLLEELGDLTFYTALLANAIGASQEEIFAISIRKSTLRYPNGFTPEDSINRKVNDSTG